jgi:hypothetical protein
VKPLRAIIDKRERFRSGAPFSIGEGSRSAPWVEHGGRKHGFAGGRHLGERIEGLAVRQNGGLASANVRLAVGFSIVRRR